jgi:hypothetical protein
MDITIKLTAPKGTCQHVVATYTSGKETLKRAYLISELKEIAKLEDAEPQLKEIVAKTVVDCLAKEPVLADTEKAVTL